MLRTPRSGSAMVLVLVAAATIMSAALGIRATFGLFLLPVTGEHTVSLALLAFAIAIQNLAWGAAQPLAGSLADRRGPLGVVAAGACLYAAGLLLVAWQVNAFTIVLGLGVLAGAGQSATTFAVVIAAVSRAAKPSSRATAVAIAAAGGSLGQVALVPLVQLAIANVGFRFALVFLALVVLAVAPLGYFLTGRDKCREATVTAVASGASWGGVWSALRNPNYVFLTAGFFACGFQLAFIGNHLPAYLASCHLAGGVGAASLATIGFFNIIGCYGFGRLMDRVAPQTLLAGLYLTRSSAALVFLAVPPSATASLAFAVVMGLTWLATVPLTSGIVTRLFGVQQLGTLFGVCFLSHQAGSFLGALLGGIAVEWTGSYASVWIATIVLGYTAALLSAAVRTPVLVTA